MNQPLGDLILASSSPIRLSLLKQIGFEPSEIVSPDINEDVLPMETPMQYAERVSKTKVSVVAMNFPGRNIIGADTVVCCGSKILPKALTPDVATKCLHILSGKRHRVITVVSVFSAQKSKMISRSCTSVIRFKRLTENEILSYIKSNEWINKAGGCCLQGSAGKFVIWMRGSYTSCIGMPLYEAYCLLNSI